jgi:hypothetical protein
MDKLTYCVLSFALVITFISVGVLAKVRTHRRPMIFEERFGKDTWVNTLNNPCRGEPTPYDWANDTALNVDGRLPKLLAFVRSARSRVTRLVQDLVSTPIIFF